MAGMVGEKIDENMSATAVKICGFKCGMQLSTYTAVMVWVCV